MQMTDLDFHFPPELIATHPAHPRDHSRLLVYRRAADSIEHLHFYNLPDLLNPTDLLILNDAKVLPARLHFQRPTGAQIPGLFIAELSPGQWQVMLRSRGKLSPGDTLLVQASKSAPDVSFRLLARLPDRGHWLIEVTPPLAAPLLLAQIGHVPLPPYIEKARQTQSDDGDESADRTEYQTIFAQNPGSLAAPTAGLHFTPDLLVRLAAKGIATAPITLHVGLGTFLPVETDTLEAHKMHAESYHIPLSTIAALRAQRVKSARIVVIGTTAARTLESAAPQILAPNPPVADISASTTLCISPGYSFALTDILLTNFHLPRSTLLALVAAMIGLERLQQIYAEAIAQKYRFYSYGDAMIILP